VDTAYDLLPVRHGVKLDKRGGKSLALSICAGLCGDRVVAAQTLPLLDRLRAGQYLHPLDVARSRSALSPLMASSSPQNRPTAGGAGMTQSQPNELVDLLMQGAVWYRTAKNIDADHAEIEVKQFQREYATKATNEPPPQRTLKMFARREQGDFRIEAMEAPDFAVVQKPVAKAQRAQSGVK